MLVDLKLETSIGSRALAPQLGARRVRACAGDSYAAVQSTCTTCIPCASIYPHSYLQASPVRGDTRSPSFLGFDGYLTLDSGPDAHACSKSRYERSIDRLTARHWECLAGDTGSSAPARAHGSLVRLPFPQDAVDHNPELRLRGSPASDNGPNLGCLGTSPNMSHLALALEFCRSCLRLQRTSGLQIDARRQMKSG
jgi:hypothetical protein